MEALSMAVPDEDVIPEKPAWPLDGAFPEAGFAVFRSDLGPDAFLTVIQGENGAMRENGGVHEHSDPASFLVHAFGEYLVLDPGYINWENHEKVMYGKDHNVILVDGKGPPTAPGQLAVTDAFLSGFDPDPWATRVTVTVVPPMKAGEPEPEVEPEGQGDGWVCIRVAFGQHADFACTNQSGRPLEATLSQHPVLLPTGLSLISVENGEPMHLLSLDGGQPIW